MEESLSKAKVSVLCLHERERLVLSHVNDLPEDRVLSLYEISCIIDQVETEYKQFLLELWSRIQGKDGRTLDDILDKRYNRFFLKLGYAKQICLAHADAEEVTVWEQITNSNYQDIKQLNVLVRACAIDVLAHITSDFMEDVSYISCPIQH